MKMIIQNKHRLKGKTFFNLNLIIFFIIFIIIKSQNDNSEEPPKYEIHISFDETGLRTLYCDDNIELFETEKINFYKKDENDNKINIGSFIERHSTEGYCQYPIKYNVTNVNEIIIMEIIGSPNKIKQLFADSHISRIERFDYPFPLDETDFNGMFYHCTSLKYVDLSNFSFEKTKDVSKFFYSCPNLIEVIFPTEISFNIDDFSDMFAFSTGLKKIDLSSFSFIKAKNTGYMFNGCTNIEEIIFPLNEKVENLEIASDMFSGCKNLLSLDFSGFSLKKIRNLGYMFNGCSNLISIKFNLEEKATNIQHIKYMFSGCSKLTSLDISSFSFVNLVDINSMFSGCSSLVHLELPKNETATNIQDFTYMFQGCSNLTEIDLSSIDFVNAKKLPYMFYNCKSLKYIELPTSEKATKIESCHSMFLYCESLISIDLSKFSFANVNALTAMFLYCINLETVILPKDELSTSVQDISFMFSICFKLKSIDLSGISFTNIVDMSYLFSNCINLETIIFPEDVNISSNIEQFSYVFANCHRLKKIDLSEFNLEKVNDISYLFFSCINTEEIIAPKRKLINVEIMEKAFENCTKLESIDLSWINMSSIINLNYAFANCENLKNLTFSEEEKIENIVQMDSTFANCTSLTSLNLSNFYIDKDANLDKCFLNCFSLKEINIWNIITSRANSTFNFLKGDSLEGCLYHSYDNINLGDSITNKICSKYIGFQKCGPCINNNDNEYCNMNIDGENLRFYYLDFEANLSISERQCYWSKNYENVVGYMFLNNTKKKKISYYIDYCDNYCEECSDDKNGCLKCKNNLYPIDTEYDEFIKGSKLYYYCYNSYDMKNYYFDYIEEQFIKCAENCSECVNGPNLCSKCNNEKDYYKVEGEDNLCWKKNMSIDYWMFDEKAKEFRQCNERCKICKIQSKSTVDHQCLECRDNYHSYYTDYLNFNKGITSGLNCYTIDEVKKENENYYLNGNYYEKCDDSCAQCENQKDFCTKCQINYYSIYGKNKEICYKYPLENYTVAKMGDESVFMECFPLCKYCHQVSKSFLYQQCSECDEIYFTKDIYSLNQSYCIPIINSKNNNNFVKEDKKWFIKDFDGIEEFTINNELYTIDYQRLLQGEKFKDLKYEIVDECPKEKPYIIFTTRQCVSNCASSNLLEFGIFMTQKLYLYNNLCYNKCPYGSDEDDENSTCIEKNKYTKVEKYLSKTYFQENQKDYILEYLGDKYARETYQFIRSEEFTAIHYKQNNTSDNVEKMKSLKMPIFDFSECIAELIKYYNLNSTENIYLEIIEKYNENSIINSTSYQFFKDDGEILDHSCCKNKNMIVMKNINTTNFDLSIIDTITNLKNLFMNISDSEFIDYCIPISYNDIDYTVKERQLLINKAKQLCDDGCEFIVFDFTKNYSVCSCKMDEEEDIISGAKELATKIDFLEAIQPIIDEGNWKYFYCYKTIKKYIRKSPALHKNFLIFTVFLFESLLIISFIIYFYKSYRKSNEVYIGILRNININNNFDGVIIIVNNDNDNNNHNEINNDNEITQDYFRARVENNNFLKVFSEYLKQKLLILLCLDRNSIETLLFKIIKLMIVIENYFFISIYLFNDYYIAVLEDKDIKNKEIEKYFFIIFKRAILIIPVCYVINTIIFFFFDGLKKLRKAQEILRDLGENTYKRRIFYLQKVFKLKLIIGFIIVLIFNLACLYFSSIIGFLFPNFQTDIFLNFLISFVIYNLGCVLVIFFTTLLRWISLLCNYQIFEYIFNLSITIADLV